LLAQFGQLHLCRHVTHGPHEIPQVLVRDEPITVLVKLKKCFPELWKSREKNIGATCHSQCGREISLETINEALIRHSSENNTFKKAMHFKKA
jgi:hypothetical protein